MNISFPLNDQRDFEPLFNEWYARLVLFAESYSVGRPEAEEVVSEAFVKFWEVRANFHAVGQIKKWLYTVIRNDCLMSLRHKKVVQKHAEALHETASFSESDDARVAEAELVGIVMEQIRQLPDRCREIMLLTYPEGMTSKEIAERLHISSDQRRRLLFV